MALSDPYGGEQLNPLSPIPEELSGKPIEDIIESVRDWFFHNFEDPAEHTPHDEGEYVYIWGGPYDTRDIIENVFADSLTDDEITQVIEDLENDGVEWVPSERRILPPEDDDDEPPLPTPEELRAVLQARIAEAEAAFQEVEPHLQNEAPPGLGHNNPPERIDEAPVSRAEFEELRAAIAILKAQPVEPSEDDKKLATGATETVDGIVKKIGTYVNKLADVFVTELVKRGAQATVGIGGWEVWRKLGGSLQNVVDAAQHWLHSINLPF